MVQGRAERRNGADLSEQRSCYRESQRTRSTENRDKSKSKLSQIGSSGGDDGEREERERGREEGFRDRSTATGDENAERWQREDEESETKERVLGGTPVR